jgi:thiol:disulfide interchange protein DsbD
LNDDYVLISLYVDDKTPLPQPVKVTDVDGQERTLRTVGDKWSHLQRMMVNMNTQPCYVLLDAEGRLLNGIRSYDEDVDAYVDFLQTGLMNFFGGARYEVRGTRKDSRTEEGGTRDD